MPPRCLHCAQPLLPGGWFDGWCNVCAGAVLREVLAIGDRRAGEVRIMADMFRMVDARVCAQVVTRVPFEVHV